MDLFIMPLKQPEKSLLPESEWFYPFDVEDLPSSGKTVKMIADTPVLKAIAERLLVSDVLSLAAELRLTPQNGGHTVKVTGHFKAEIVQECVITLAPVHSILEDDFEAWYADHEKAIPFNRAKRHMKTIEEGAEIQILEEKDDPEALVNGQIDLGEVVIQFLSLSIDPYPRAESVRVSEGDSLPESATSAESVASAAMHLRPNPFAALKNWRPQD